MKNTIIVGTILSVSLSLIGCGTLHNTTQTSTSMVNTGERVVKHTGHAVGTTVNAGINLLTGKPATQHDVVVYRKHGVIHNNGHIYKIEQGKYVLVR